jgi:hypothetical protein
MSASIVSEYAGRQLISGMNKIHLLSSKFKELKTFSLSGKKISSKL